jgi:hypothetical protein
VAVNTNPRIRNPNRTNEPTHIQMLHHPHGQMLKHLEVFAGSTWDWCLYAFEECIIQVQKLPSASPSDNQSLLTDIIANGNASTLPKHVRFISRAKTSRNMERIRGRLVRARRKASFRNDAKSLQNPKHISNVGICIAPKPPKCA